MKTTKVKIYKLYNVVGEAQYGNIKTTSSKYKIRAFDEDEAANKVIDLIVEELQDTFSNSLAFSVKLTIESE